MKRRELSQGAPSLKAALKAGLLVDRGWKFNVSIKNIYSRTNLIEARTRECAKLTDLPAPPTSLTSALCPSSRRWDMSSKRLPCHLELAHFIKAISLNGVHFQWDLGEKLVFEDFCWKRHCRATYCVSRLNLSWALWQIFLSLWFPGWHQITPLPEHNPLVFSSMIIR